MQYYLNNLTYYLAFLLVCGGLLQPTLVVAQKKPTPIKPSANVSLKATNSRVSSLIDTIMTRAKLNYTLDTGLSDSYVTINLNNVPLRTALDSIAKVATRPFGYTNENGVYHFVLKEGMNLAAQRVTLQVQNSNLENVLVNLMKSAHASYILAPEIVKDKTATVTLNLADVPFHTALDSVIKASRLAIGYRIEKGSKSEPIYHVMLRSKLDEIEDLNAGRIKYTEASLKKGGNLSEVMITIDFADVYLTHALKKLMDKVSVRYEIDATVDDSVITGRIENVPLPKALEMMVKMSGQPLVYSFERDVLRFRKKE